MLLKHEIELACNKRATFEAHRGFISMGDKIHFLNGFNPNGDYTVSCNRIEVVVVQAHNRWVLRLNNELTQSYNKE